ncbi:MAG: hypothetical protein K6C98_02545 [Treponema sp.]|nr:hypothetical protein [Treponema sp.]
MNKSISIPIELDEKKIKMLVSFFNSTEDEEMSLFVEDILKKANSVSLEMQELSKKIMSENPFSQKYL